MKDHDFYRESLERIEEYKEKSRRLDRQFETFIKCNIVLFSVTAVLLFVSILYHGVTDNIHSNPPSYTMTK